MSKGVSKLEKTVVVSLALIEMLGLLWQEALAGGAGGAGGGRRDQD